MKRKASDSLLADANPTKTGDLEKISVVGWMAGEGVLYSRKHLFCPIPSHIMQLAKVFLAGHCKEQAWYSQSNMDKTSGSYCIIKHIIESASAPTHSSSHLIFLQ